MNAGHGDAIGELPPPAGRVVGREPVEGVGIDQRAPLHGQAQPDHGIVLRRAEHGDAGIEANEWASKETDAAVAAIIADWKSKGIAVNALSENDKRKWAKSIKEIPVKWAKDLDAKGKPGTKVLKAYVKAAEGFGFKFPYGID